MEYCSAGGQIEVHGLQNRLFAIFSGNAIEVNVANNGDKFLCGVRICICKIQFGVGVLNLYLDFSGLVVDGGIKLCSRSYCINSFQVWTGEGSYAAALPGLAEEKGEAIFAGRFKTGDGLGAGRDIIGSDVNPGGFSASNDKFHTHGGEVCLVGSVVPGNCDAVGGSCRNRWIKGVAHSLCGESLLKICPVGRFQRSAGSTDPGIETLVHCKGIHCIRDLVGTKDISFTYFGAGVGGGNLVRVVGLFVNLELITIGIFDFLP